MTAPSRSPRSPLIVPVLVAPFPSSIASTPATSGGANVLRVMLVDDDADCRLLVRDAVEEAIERPVNFYEYPSGVAALAAVSEPLPYTPDLVLMDMEMPGLDGVETVRRLRATGHFAGVPIVMLSGLADGAAIAAATEAGATSYAVKPADAERFVQTVTRTAEYWLVIHQTASRHRPQSDCRR